MSGRWLLLLALLIAGSAFAEGSRTLFPASTPVGGARAALDLNGATFAGVSIRSQFLYVYAQKNEYILLGSSNVGAAATATTNDIFVYNPQSFGTKGLEYNTVSTLTPNFKCSSQAASGSITSRNQELAGPNSADNTVTVTNGYKPCYYQAPNTGIYGVRFTAASANTGSKNQLGTVGPLTDSVAAWDVAVRGTNKSVTDINGRVFTYSWDISTGGNGPTDQIWTSLYYVSVDGYRYQQTMRGIDPNGAAFYANSLGFLDSNGSPLYHDIRGNDAQVSTGNYLAAGIAAQAPQYPIFFSDVAPDNPPTHPNPNAVEVDRILTALAIPQTPPSPQLSSVSFTGNVGGNTSTVSSGGTYTFTTVNTQTYQIVISRGAVAAGADPNYPAGCTNDFDPANVCNRVLTGIATTGTHNIPWDGKDNSGFAFPAGNYSYQIMGRNGEIHFPMLDVEGNVNGGPTLQKLNGSQDSMVYYDDRGYKTANGTVVGAANGALCAGTAGAGEPVPTPDHSLLGIDSMANLSYRNWTVWGNSNADCANSAQGFGDAKGLDLWGFEKTSVFVNPIVIVPLPPVVDVGTSASATSSVISGGTAYDNFTFFNAGANTATGVTYTVALGTPATPTTCPAAVTFTLVPAGVTPTYHPAPACNITFTGMPTTLTGGQSLNFGFNYVVAATNPGPIPLTTTIAATNENCTTSCSPNTATAQTVVATPIITVVKSASPAAGTQVTIGSTITYTVSVQIDSAPLTSTFTLTDALGTGLTFGSVTNAGSFTCSGSLTCTLPSGTATGTYAVTYTAVVNSSAVGSVANNVTPSGGGGSSPPTCNPCSVSNTVPAPSLGVTKTSNGPWTVGQGGATYTLMVTNSGAAATSGTITVKDALPNGITAAATFTSGSWSCTTAGQTVTCTSTTSLAATNGSSTITIPVTVGATAAGTVVNNASVGGGGDPNNGGGPPTPGSCTAGDPHCGNTSTNVVAPPSIAKAFGASSVALNGTTTLTFTVTNPSANTVSLTGVSFSDSLPAGMTVATTPGVSNTCGGTVTAAANSTSVSLSGVTLAAGTFCTLTVNVTGTTAGTKNNSVTVSSFNGGTGNTGTATTTVVAPPTIGKTFGAASIPLNGATTLTFTITNPAANTVALNGVSFIDNLPPGMTVASTPGVVSNCGGTATAAANSNSVSLSGVSLAVGASCALTVNVTGTAAGTMSNSVTVSSTNGGTGNTSTATLTVVAPPSIAKIFTPASIPVNGTTTLTFTITNPAANTVALTGVSFLDTLPTGLTVSNATTSVCGGTLSVTNPTGISLANATIAVGGTCQFSVTVTGAASGFYINRTGLVTSSNAGAGNQATAFLTVLAPPTISKAFGASTIPLNGSTSLSFTITNPNASPLTGVSVADTLPSGMTVATPNGLAGSCGSGTITAVAGSGNVSLAGGTLAANGSCTFSVNVTGTTAGTKNNVTGTVTSTEGGTGGTASATTTVVAPPTISKVFGASSITVNGSTSLTFTITNPNPTVPLTGVSVTDALPSGMTVATPNGLTGSCGSGTITATAGSGSVSLSGGALAANGSCTFGVNVTGTTVGAKNNVTGNVTSTEGGTGGTATATLTVNGQPSLGVTKTSNGPWTVGQGGATYTLTVTNTGLVATSGTITVDDTLPNGITAPASFTSGSWTCSTVGQSVACSSSSSIAVNVSSTITMPVAVGAAAAATGSVKNNASVGGGGDPNNGGGPPTPGTCAPADPHCGSTITPVSPAADIAVTKTVDNATPSVGNNVTFTITATNNGPNDATGVQVTDSLPAGLTFVSATPSQGTFNQTSGVWNIGALANGASVTLAITAKVTQPGTITNTATVTASDQTDPNASNNSASASLNPPAAGLADIQVYKTVDNATPSVGSTINYTITVKNAGPDNATGVAITDQLPTGLTFVSATPSQGSFNAATGVWTIGSVANGASVTLAIQATVTQAGPITNTATKTAEDQTDPNTSNDSSSVTINNNGSSVADIQVVKSVDNTAPNVGSNVTFTISARNNGPDNATNVQVTDALPAGLALVSATPSQGTYVSTTGLWTIGSLPVNATTTLTIVATVTQPGGITNTATVSHSDQTDPVSSNNSSSVNLGAVPTADLSIVKTDGQTTAVPGTLVTYTITVKNAGPSDAIGATVADTLPATLTGATWTCTASAGSSCMTSGAGNINDTVTVLNGGTLTYTLKATIDPSATGSVTNTATVTAPSGTTDPNPGNNSSTDTDTLAPQADLAITKTDGVTTVVPGGSVTYTIVATNLGPSNVVGAIVADTLPASLTGATWTCVGAGGGTCTASGSGNINDTVSLPVGASVTYTVTATVDPAATGTLSNTATVAAPAGVTDPNPGNNSATDTDTIAPINPPSIAKSFTPNTISAGGTTTLTLTISNPNTGVALTGASFTDAFPLGMSVASPVTANNTCGGTLTAAAGAGSISLSGGSVPKSGSCTITVVVTDVAPGTAVNTTGAVSSTNGGTGNTATASLTVVAPAVAYSKSVALPGSQTTAKVGDTLTYTLKAAVSGSPLTGTYTLTDTLGAGQTFGSVTSAGAFTCTGTLQCTLPAGTAIGTYTLTYTTTVNSNATSPVTNTVTGSGGGTAATSNCDPAGVCNTSVNLTAPTVLYSKSVALPGSQTTANAGDTLTYTLKAVVGNSALTNTLTLTDTLGAGQTFGTVMSAGGFTANTAGAPTLIFTLPSGTVPGTYTLTYTTVVNNNATAPVTNAVTGSGGGSGVTPGCDPSAACTTTVNLTTPTVTYSKTSVSPSGTVVNPGDTITYKLKAVVANSALSNALTLTDTLSGAQTFGSVTSAGSFTANTGGAPVLTFTLPSGTVPGTYTVTYTTTVNANATGSVGNSVVGSGGGSGVTPGCDVATGCITTHPLAANVSIKKALTAESGVIAGVAEPGETLTYQITLSNSGGVNATNVGTTDPLDANVTFVSADNGGTAAASTVTWTGLTVPAGGTLVLTVKTQVVNPIPQGVTQVGNLAYVTGTSPPDCTATPLPQNCVVTPTAANLSVTKALSGESITQDGIAEPGEVLTYTITVRNQGGTAANSVIVDETVPQNTTYVADTPNNWTCANASPAGTACSTMVNVPAQSGAQPGIATVTFKVKVDDPLPAGVTSIVNAVVLNGGGPPDCSVSGTPGCAVVPTVNVRMTKTVASVTTTGPSTFLVTYQIEVDNVGGSNTTYTLDDTLGFPQNGVVFIGNATVATTGGTLNPALVNGQFAPANGSIEQLSASNVALAVGAQHFYTVAIPIGVQPASLQNAACTGAAGNGLYNEASLSGAVSLTSSACAPVNGSVPLIKLVKTVTLGQDLNGNHYGDVGDVLAYQFTISNTGTVPLSAVQLFDPLVQSLQCTPLTANGVAFRVIPGDEVFYGPFGGAQGGTLNPGDSITCSASYTLAASDVARRRVVNSATATGTGPAGQAVSSVGTAIFTQFR